MPVAVIQHSATAKDSPTFRKGSEEWKLRQEIELKKRDALIEKSLPGSFTGTGLERRALDAAAICGYLAQICCVATARQAFHSGFLVVFLSDAAGTLVVHTSARAVSAPDMHRAVMVYAGDALCQGD